jgi:hypothetical protein
MQYYEIQAMLREGHLGERDGKRRKKVTMSDVLPIQE